MMETHPRISSEAAAIKGNQLENGVSSCRLLGNVLWTPKRTATYPRGKE